MKIFNNKKLFYAGIVGILGVVLLIYSIVSLTKNKPTTYSGDFNVTTPQMYINDFTELIPGCNDPNLPNNNIDVDTRLDILTLNNTDKIPVSIQHIITIYAKALETLEYENINAGDYLDASKFYVSIDDNGVLKEAEDKYYILNNKTTVLANKYSPTDGEIIAVRYYVPGENLPAPSDENSPVYSVDSYKIGLSMEAPLYYTDTSEINVTVKTQATADSIDLANWVTVDSNVMFSTGYSGVPIDVNNLYRDNSEIETDSIPETTEVPVSSDTEPVIVETTLSSDVETLAPTTTGQEESSETSAPVTEPSEETTTTTVPVTEEEITTTTTADNRIFPEGMSINTGSVDLKVGETYTFSVTFDPVNSTETGLSWASNNTNIATVNANGTVTAVGEGTASISVTSVNGMVLTVYVNVKPNVVAIYPEQMSIDTGSVTLNPGETYKFSITFAPDNTTETGLTWVSSDSNIATVDSNGTVTAISSGTASITVTSVNGMVLTVQVIVN